MKGRVSPELNTVLLADLGQRVLNAIATTQVLGHTRLSHSLVYAHSYNDPAVDLVQAVLDGDMRKVDAALAEWERIGPESACERYGIDPTHILAPATEPGDVSATAVDAMRRMGDLLADPT